MECNNAVARDYYLAFLKADLLKATPKRRLLIQDQIDVSSQIFCITLCDKECKQRG